MKYKTAFILRVFISIVFLVFMFIFIDLDNFENFWSQIKWNLVIYLVFINIILLVLYGYRWWSLLEQGLPLQKAIAITVVGLGANMILPARGGDLLRAYHSIHCTSKGIHLVLARLFMEKFLDLCVVLLVGCTAFLVLGIHKNNLSFIVIPLLFALILLSIIFLFRWHSQILAQVMRKLFSAIRLGHIFDRYIYQFFHEIQKSISQYKLFIPIIISFVLWTIPYTLFYITCASMINIDLSYWEIQILLLAAAIGLAIPAAPSGLGTFHAAITSGIVLLGYSVTEGVLLATVIHAFMFITLVVSAALTYPFLKAKAINYEVYHIC